MDTAAKNQLAAKSTVRSQTITVLSLAFFLRLFVLFVVAVKYPPDWLFRNGTEMSFLAKSFLTGHGLSSPFGVPTGPTAFIAPAYPLLVALVFHLFGAGSHASAIVIMSAQLLLNVATVWLMMHIARELFCQRTALISGLVWACALPLLWLPTILWDTCTSIFALVALLALAMHLRRGPRLRLWLLLGLGCAVTALFNPALVLVLLAILAWTAFHARPRRAVHVSLALLVFLLVYSPWIVRNARVFHAFVPLRTTVGMELWMGNRPGATGFLDESIFPTFNPQELQAYQTQGEIAYTNHKTDLALVYIRAHPSTFARLTAIRIVRFWFGTGTSNGPLIFALYAGFTTIFGCAGLCLMFLRRQRSSATLFLLVLLLFPLPYYITHAEFRYRMVLDPVLAILAAYALVAIAARFTQRRPQ